MKQYSERDLERMYDDMLDEVYPDCQIAGLTYSTSHALKELDPTAYRCGFNDWLDGELGESIFEHADGEYYDEAEDSENE